MTTNSERKAMEYPAGKHPFQDEHGVWRDDDLHAWFELSYAQYLTIPRTALQSMPLAWKNKLAALLNELDETIDWRPKDGRYWCRLRNSKGQIVIDPLADYQRGRRLLPHKTMESDGAHP